MDTIAYTILGLCGLLALVWGGVYLISLATNPIGRAILMGYGLILLAGGAVVSAVWLLATH